MNHLDPNSTAVPEVLEYITTKFVNDSGLYVYEPNKAFGSVLPEFTGGFFNSFS